MSKDALYGPYNQHLVRDVGSLNLALVVLVFAALTGEEQGLLGSEYFSKHPPIEAGRIAADINIDGVSIFGRTKDITMVGLGKSSLDPIIVALAKMQGRVVKPDQFPDRGFFYRSDQFNLAKVGVPAAYFDSGTEVIGKPDGWGKKRIEEWEEKDYHQPSDELNDQWDLGGAVEDVPASLLKSLPATLRAQEGLVTVGRSRGAVTAEVLVVDEDVRAVGPLDEHFPVTE